MRDPRAVTPASAPGRPLKRILSAAAAALGLVPGAVQAEAPEAIAPHAAPQAWLDYARLVSDQVQARFASDDPVAVRLRDYLNQLPGANGPQGATLQIAYWIDKVGMITRIGHQPFAHTEPNDDLKALMVGLKLPEAPPGDMLLPLRLAIQIKPKEEPKLQAFVPSRPISPVNIHVSFSGPAIIDKRPQ